MASDEARTGTEPSLIRGVCERIERAESILERADTCHWKNGVLTFKYKPVLINITQAFVCARPREPRELETEPDPATEEGPEQYTMSP